MIKNILLPRVILTLDIKSFCLICFDIFEGDLTGDVTGDLTGDLTTVVFC